MIRLRTTAVYVLAAALPVTAVLESGSASATDQPGVTEPAQQPGVTPVPAEQPGVSSPAPTPPPRPPDHSLVGDLVPDPPTYAPTDYRNPPTPSTEPNTTLGQDLGRLHAPAPVPPTKVIVPPPADYIGVGDVKFPRPQWVPADLAWKINSYVAGWQRDTDSFFDSVGFDPSRSDRMATAGVLCAGVGFGAGALVTGIPAAVAGALIGSTIGGIVGAGVGTLIPVPVFGTVTSGIAGTAIGAVAGAVATGIPVAIIGGTATALVGGAAAVIATAGDGSDAPPPPKRRPVPAPRPPAAPIPDVHAQVKQVTGAGVHAAEQTVHWVQAQPGGEQALDAVANAGAAAGAALGSLPGAAQVSGAVGAAVHDVVVAAKAAPATAAVANAVADVVGHHPPFTAQELGPLAGAANNALAAVQAVVR
ncbi:hypothetical protein [Nocardia alni]|uniref:hypothetical protein n=1 Tax=Nocardia alni TaxID=2815723 RepID=UPI001C21AE14|nr:hypothetical protein [Nocardia alni]